MFYNVDNVLHIGFFLNNLSRRLLKDHNYETHSVKSECARRCVSSIDYFSMKIIVCTKPNSRAHHVEASPNHSAYAREGLVFTGLLALPEGGDHH